MTNGTSPDGCRLAGGRAGIRWIADPDADTLKLRAGDHALIIERCEYGIDRTTGVVEVRDYTDPRSMRYQRSDPRRPGQPFFSPSSDLDGGEVA